jgi:hypothetical protein
MKKIFKDDINILPSPKINSWAIPKSHFYIYLPAREGRSILLL